MVRRKLLIATSTFFTCGLLLQTGAQYSAAGNTRACVEIRSVLAEAPQVVPASRRTSEPLDVNFPATSSRCCLKFRIRFRRTPRRLLSISFSVIEMVGGRNCLAYTKLNTPFPKVVFQDGNVFVDCGFGRPGVLLSVSAVNNSQLAFRKFHLLTG